MDSVEPDLITG